jgi:hypothetical protein
MSRQVRFSAWPSARIKFKRFRMLQHSAETLNRLPQARDSNETCSVKPISEKVPHKITDRMDYQHFAGLQTQQVMQSTGPKNILLDSTCSSSGRLPA